MSVFIDSEKCKGCAICVSLCPVQAISIIQNKALIDQNKCNECMQCLDECPNDAIQQTYDKEISVTERQDSIPYPVHHTSPQSNPVLGSYKGKQRTFNRSGSLLDRIKEVANSFLQDDSFFGRGRKVRKSGHQGYRRRHRRGRL